MQQHDEAKGANAERSSPKLSFSIFVRICSTKRAHAASTAFVAF